MIRPAVPPTPGSVARHYDDLDPFYRELWGEHLHHGLFDPGGPGDPQEAAARLVALVAERAGIRAGSRVCDVGCGYGATARLLAEAFGARVMGITLSRAQWEHACAPERRVEGVEIRLGDWLSGELPEEHFDAVVAIECFSHMPDPPGFFRQVFRVLRPGGRWVVCAWLSGDAPGPGVRRYLLEPICREGRLAGLHTAAEIRSLALEAGLHPISSEDLTRRVARTWSISVRRVAGGLLRRRDYRRFLLTSRVEDRAFALTVFRIRAAYALGGMRYGLFAGRRP